MSAPARVVENEKVPAPERERRVLRARFRPRPKLTVTQWADRYRVLSPEASFRAGPYSSDDAPYQKEMQDAMSDALNHGVVFMLASQTGKTEIFNNGAGFHVDQDPCPMLMVQPTLDMAKAWSKDRLATMIRDTPRLRGKIREAKSRDSEVTMLHKRFYGGHLTIAGANSPAGLASRPIRIVFLDEIDRYPASAGAEGDPTSIVESRTSTFPNAKIHRASSPTLEGGPIDKAYKLSDQREYWVPCPHCGHEQLLEFGGLKEKHGIKWDGSDASTAHYVCIACACVIEEHEKLGMLKRGRWIAKNPESKTPGFRLSAIYSPFFTWARLIERWLRDHKDPLKLRAFVNTILCEPWNDAGEGVTEHILKAHCDFRPTVDVQKGDEVVQKIVVPAGAALLTRSVDVQADRIETAVYAWGEGEECWRVDFELIPGSPAQKAVWNVLGQRIGKKYEHESGAVVGALRTFIDTGGHYANEAYDFARGRLGQGVYAIKGSSLQEGVQLLGPPTHHKEQRVITYQVGSFTGKEALMTRLAKVEQPGPRWIHLPEDTDYAHLEQFLAEKLVTQYGKTGRPVRAWVQKGPNEQVDLWVYAFAALHSLDPKIFKNLGEIAKKLAESAQPKPPEPSKPTFLPTLRPPTRKSYANWKP